MNLRYTLNNDIEGEHITAYSPKGWEDMELVFKRHEKYDGIFKDYVVKAEFFCGAGKEYIDNIEDTQGVEAVVSILIEIDCDDSGTYQTLYSGLIMFDTHEKTSAAPEYTRVNIKQDDIVQTILSRLETKVNLSSLESLNGTVLDQLTYAPYELTMHSKAVVDSGLFNFTDPTDEPETPAGWTLEGSNPDAGVTLSYNISESTRTMEHSFSQSIIPEITVFDEVPGYDSELGTLARSDTYPGTTAQIQSENLYSDIEQGSYTVSGKFKYAFQTIVTLTYSGQGSGITKDFRSILTPRLYLKVGSTITLLETKAVVDITTSMPTSADVVGAVTTVVPLQELTFEFSQLVSDVPEGETIRVYVNFDSQRIIERPEFNEGAYDIDIVMYSYVNQDFSECLQSYIRVDRESVEEDTTANAFAIFETGAQITRVITDQEDSFRSNYFGRTNSEPYAYEENGCGSFTAITNGFQIRGFPLIDFAVDSCLDTTESQGRPVYMSMKEYFEGLCALYCLGLGVKQEGVNTFIEVEPKEYFYTDDVIFNLSNIKNLNTKVDKKYFYNKINIGFNHWRKSEGSVNGLDEFCTKQEYVTLNKNVSQTLDAVTNLVAGPYPIELLRRLQFEVTPTEDTDFDDKNFIIALNRTTVDGIPTNLDVAEKDENFTNVTNVLSPETIYNLRFKPARILRNWYKVIGTGLIKLNDTLKTIKFSFGEGNYNIESQGTGSCDPAQNALVEAGQDVEIIIPGTDALEPLFTGHVDEFEVPFSLSQYNELRELDDDGNPNYYKKIGYSTEDADFLQGFILDCRYKPIRGKAAFKTARAYNKTLCSHIYVEADYVECDYVE
jgi:hypothetical protein